MPSVIVTKIDADLRQERDNNARACGLADYCISPENSDGNEKCVAFKALGFSEENPDIELIKDEMLFDMDKSYKKNLELVAHWVMSFKGEPEPKENSIFDAADALLMDLGYTEHHKRYFAIHKDTDHIHCHIVACKSDPFTGKVNGENWWKNECQKSIARSAYKHKWQLEPGAPFVVPANPKMETIKQNEREITRPVVVRRGKEKDAPSVRCYAAKMERRTGLKSGQRVLQEVLRDFVAEHEQDFPRWKCGHFHKALAEIGVTCERVQHGNTYGLTYSLDGENFESATATCPQLTYNQLLGKLSSKSWRDARDEHKEIAARARQDVQPQQLMPQEQAKVVFSKDVIDKMRQIPAKDVWNALGVEPKEKNRSGKKIVNAFDVCLSQGMSFSESTDFLAANFQDRLKGLNLSIDPDAMLDGVRAEGVEISEENLSKARQIAHAMGAIRADKLNLTVKSDSKNHLLAANYNEQSLADICKKLDLLTANDNEIWAAPIMSKGRRAIVVTSVKPEIFDHFPDPSLQLAGGSGAQAVYVLSKNSKYDQFYDFLQDRVNARFGDPTQKPLIKMPGLNKDVRIFGSNDNICQNFQDYANRVYERWAEGSDDLPALKQGLYNTEREDITEDLLELGLKEAERLMQMNFDRVGGNVQYQAQRIVKYEKILVSVNRFIQKPTQEQFEIACKWRAWARNFNHFGYYYGTESEKFGQAMADLFEALFLMLEALYLLYRQMKIDEAAAKERQEKMLQKQEYILKIQAYAAEARIKIDQGKEALEKEALTPYQAKQIDIAVARELYAKGATPNQVFSYMSEHSKQIPFVEEEEREKVCKRIAVNAAPANLLGTGSKYKQGKKGTYRRNTQATPGINLNIDRQRQMEQGQKPVPQQQMEQKNGQRQQQ